MEGEARERLIIEVSFDRRRGQYVASHPALRAPVSAFTVSSLRQRLEAQLKGEAANIRLVLDKQARERDSRRARCGWGGAEQWGNT